MDDDGFAYLETTRQPNELFGYQYGDLLGVGGFGEVFAARRISDDKPVAIKLARRDRFSASERLLHEARTLSAIGTPHVPEVYDSGVVPDGPTYLVMQRIEHPTLAVVMEAETQIKLEVFASIARALLRALAAVHQAGYAHRDLKPENIFWDQAASRVTLIDFSLGRSTAADAAQLHLTTEGLVLGTVEYMAPEQCEPGAAIDHRADIYAIGVLFYELLTKHPPFWGAATTVRLAQQVRRPPPMNLGDPFPAALEDVVMRCLQKQAGQRYQNADALMQALEHALIEKREPSSSKTGRPRVRPQHTAMDMPVVYFRSTQDLGAIQQTLIRYGGTLANVSGDRYAAVLTELSGESPVERASMAAQGLLDMGISNAATVDFTRVTRRVGPDGSQRHRSAAFSREHLYPEASDAGVLRTDEAELALPTLVQVPLLGRYGIIDRLHADILSAVERRLPTISTLIGPGGYGKSAIARKLSDMVHRMFPGGQVFTMRASPPFGGAAQATLRLLLQWIFNLTNQGLSALNHERLRKFLGDSLTAELSPALALAMGWVEPEHPIVRDIAAAPGALRAATFRLLGEGMRRRASKAPLLIILDDAHMADDSTLDGLEHATLEGLELPIWVCTLARQSFESARPSWGARAARHQRMQLGALDEASAAALCRELLKPAEDVPEKVVYSLVARSQAIPLLLVELVQGLKRDHIVRRHKGSQVWFVASDEFDRRSGMPLLTWLAQSELGALPKDLAAHAQLAAMLGDGFRAAELALVLRDLERGGLAADFPLDATAGLNSLRALGMLVREPGGRLRFRHVLLREAIAQTMPQARRSELHHAAYRAYRELGAGDATMDNELRARIAYHAAHSGLHQQAMTLYLELAEIARLSHDYISAERHYTRALELSDESDAQTRMLVVRGRALMRYRVGRYIDSLDDFAQARELAVRNQDKVTEIEILLDEATALDWIDQHKQSSKQVFRAQLMAEDVPHSELIDARLHLGVGRSYWRANRFKRSRSKLEETIVIAEKHGHAGYETLINSYLVLGCVLSSLGDIDSASNTFERAVTLCEERGDLFHMAAALNNRRLVWIARNQIERVVADAERCVKIGRELGMLGFEYSALYNVAELMFHRGDLRRAWPYVTNAVRCEEQRTLIVGVGRPIALLLQARMHCYEGQWKAARTIWERVRAHYNKVTKRRVDERRPTPAEEVLLRMVELMTHESTHSDWLRLVDGANASVSPEETLEAIEMMALWAKRRGQTTLARECLERALDMADSNPTQMRERIRSTLEQLEAPLASSLHVTLER